MGPGPGPGSLAPARALHHCSQLVPTTVFRSLSGGAGGHRPHPTVCACVEGRAPRAWMGDQEVCLLLFALVTLFSFLPFVFERVFSAIEALWGLQ